MFNSFFICELANTNYEIKKVAVSLLSGDEYFCNNLQLIGGH